MNPSDEFYFRDLSASYPGGLLFQHLNGRLGAGEVLWLKGSNGSGKTTLLKQLAALSELETGSINLGGWDRGNDRLAYQAELAWLGHRDGLKPSLTIAESLSFHCAWHRLSLVPINATLRSMGLLHKADIPLSYLSQGQRKRVALATILLHQQAKLWLLDEPLTHLDSESIEIWGALASAQLARGTMMVIASHEALPFRADQLLDPAASHYLSSPKPHERGA